MRHALRIGAPHVVQPETEIAELLGKNPVSMEPPGRGGNGGVEKVEPPVLVQAGRQFQVLEKGPLRIAPDSFVRR
jgi:hypothetical protein